MHPRVPLPILCENVDFLIREHEAVGFRETATLRSVLWVCSLYRRRGIGAFLLSGAPEVLRADLRRSAEVFLSWANRRGTEGIELGRLLPLFDGVGCGDETIPLRFKKLLDVPWAADREYEEDYLFTKFVLAAVVHGVDAPVTEGILSRYEEVAADIQDVRHAICAALCANDAGSFHHALEDYLTLRRDQNIAFSKEGRLMPEEAQTEAKVSVEGLALVRVGIREGLLHPPHNYPLVADLMIR
jgi:hypothetical protein